MAETQHTTGITRVGRVMVPVTDQDAGIAFYTEKLGFETVADIPFGEGNRWIEVAPAGAETPVALVPEQGQTKAGNMTAVILATSDIDATHAELHARGVDVDAEIMRGEDTPAMFWFRDQDGNILMVVGESTR